MPTQKMRDFTFYVRIERARGLDKDDATNRLNRAMDRTGLRYYVEDVEDAAETHPERQD